MSDGLSIGVEQEYFLTDPCTGLLKGYDGKRDLALFEDRLGERFSTEFLTCMVETRTAVTRSVSDALAQVAADRRAISLAASEIGLSICPVGSHPQGDWKTQQMCQLERYQALRHELGIAVRRTLYCGLHIHFGVATDTDRLGLMRQLTPYLPFLLALSGSSPFWERENTGFHSYRTRAQMELPRSGLPPHFSRFQEFQQYIHQLEAVGVVDAGTKVWWDIRPSGKHPTLEIRIADMPPQLSDTRAIIALAACLFVNFQKTEGLLAELDGLLFRTIEQNKYIVEKHGIDALMVDIQDRSRPLKSYLHEIVRRLLPISEELNCRQDLEYCLALADEGTSSQRQLAAFELELKRTGNHESALRAASLAVTNETNVLEVA